jgi:hypothetical protein
MAGFFVNQLLAFGGWQLANGITKLLKKIQLQAAVSQ